MNATSLFANQRINVLLITIVCFLVYLNALFAGVSNLDDAGLFQAVQRGGIKAHQLFSASGGTYFRPLTLLSYLIDSSIWGTNPAAFHMTNLLLHTSNSLLVYLIANYVSGDNNQPYPGSLVAGLLFAVHPACSESVVWISGRTDLLCCTFFLLSIALLMQPRHFPASLPLLLSMTFFCSLCAKESSIVLLAIAPFAMAAGQNKFPARKAATVAAALLLTAALYLKLRSGPTGAMDHGIATAAGSLTHQHPFRLMADTLAVTGFYLGKIVWPFPLNLAIDSVDTRRGLAVGAVALTALVILFCRHRAARMPLAILLFGLVPPLLAYHAAIPWMPVAERYLYLPLTGAALLVAVMLRDIGTSGRSVWLAAIIALAMATAFRVQQWTDPVALWADTVAKSPNAAAARVIYAFELQETGRYPEAGAQLDLVGRNRYTDYLYWKCRARQSFWSGDLGNYETLMSKAAGVSKAPAEVFIEMADRLSRAPAHREEQERLLTKAIGHYETAWKLDRGATGALYAAARLSLRTGDHDRCKKLLALYLAAPGNTPEAPRARALLQGLSSALNRSASSPLAARAEASTSRVRAARQLLPQPAAPGVA